MKMNTYGNIWATVLALGVSTVVLADNDEDKKGQKDQKVQNVKLLKASDIIGMKVQNPGGENIGSINELAINSGGGYIRYAILSRGGAAGVGDTLHAVPFQAFKFTGGKEVAILDTTKDRMDKAPDFNPDGWNNIADEQWGAKMFSYYNVEPNFSLEDSYGKTRATSPRFLRGSDVVGKDVHNHRNDDLGEVNDLMIDVNSGRVGYAVLGFGGVAGINEKLFAVPWQALSFNHPDGHFVLSVEKDKLKSAPGFDKDKWPDMSDMRYSKDVHAFYDAEPNWVYGYTGNTNKDSQVNKSKDNGNGGGGWGAKEEYNRKFDAKSIQTVTGSVSHVGTCTPINGMSEACELHVQTGKEKLYVHLGPEWFVKRQDRQFNPGDQIKVTGSRVMIDGKPVILATEIESNGATLQLRNKNGHPYWSAWHSDKS